MPARTPHGRPGQVLAACWYSVRRSLGALLRAPAPVSKLAGTTKVGRSILTVTSSPTALPMSSRSELSVPDGALTSRAAPVSLALAARLRSTTTSTPGRENSASAPTRTAGFEPKATFCPSGTFFALSSPYEATTSPRATDCHRPSDAAVGCGVYAGKVEGSTANALTWRPLKVVRPVETATTPCTPLTFLAASTWLAVADFGSV